MISAHLPDRAAASQKFDGQSGFFIYETVNFFAKRIAITFQAAIDARFLNNLKARSV